MSTFSVLEPSTQGLIRKFEPPPVKSVGSYSNDADRNFIDSAANLKFTKLLEGSQDVDYDLYTGVSVAKFEEYETMVIPNRKEQNSRLVHFLQWINEHQEQFEKNRPDFVMLRGLMEKIVLTPYRCRYNEDWRVGAMRKNGTIYIRKILTKKQSKPIINSFRMRTSTWGHNFQKFVFSDEPNEKPNPLKNPNENPGAEFHVVLQTNINGHEILYSAELDGVAAKEGEDLLELNPKENLESLKDCHFVEVRTFAMGSKAKLYHTGCRSNKSRCWWVPCALGGVSHIIIGYMDDFGIVTEVETLTMKDLYEKYSSGWFADSGYKFFGDFLAQVKERVVEDETVYIFSFDRHKQSPGSFQVRLEVPDEGSQYLLENLV